MQIVCVVLTSLLGGCAGPLDRSLYPRTCQIHGTSLRPDTVKVVYGLVGSFPEQAQARAAQFPNANSFDLGGCSRSPWDPGLARVMYCPDCRRGENVWVRNELPGLRRKYQALWAAGEATAAAREPATDRRSLHAEMYSGPWFPEPEPSAVANPESGRVYAPPGFREYRGSCPRCGEWVKAAAGFAHGIDAAGRPGNWHGYVKTCPKCGAALSAEIEDVEPGGIIHWRPGERDPIIGAAPADNSVP